MISSSNFTISIFGLKTQPKRLKSAQFTIRILSSVTTIHCIYTIQYYTKIIVYLLGGRHPYLAHYKVGFEENGLIMALSMELFSNAGYSIDFSASVMNCSLYKLDNAYFIPNIYVKSHLCKTNLASNTSMRGYGGPQVAWIMENILNKVACSLEKPIDQVYSTKFSSYLNCKYYI